MKTVIIPDIHHRTDTADAIIERVNPDKIVFLGDYFDDWHDGIVETEETALWLKEMLADDRVTALYGNHDVPYAIFKYAARLYCSGFTMPKGEKANEIITPTEWAKLKLHTWVGPWLLSHAGFHNYHVLPRMRTREGFDAECEHAVKFVRAGAMHPFFQAGHDRGGPAIIGGPLWCDWSSFVATPGFNQICGHTPTRLPEIRKRKDSLDFCIDHLYTKLFAVVHDEHTEFFGPAANPIRVVPHPTGPEPKPFEVSSMGGEV